MNTLTIFAGSIQENFSNPYFIVDYVISLLIVLGVAFFIAWPIKRLPVFILFGSLYFLFFLGMTLNMPILALVSFLLIITAIIICTIINSGILRKYIAAPLKPASKSNEKKAVYDKEKLVNDIVEAVKWLSDNKVGALITFERDTPLDDFMRNATRINCPVTPEIIETIFYEGTRLHDGAIIIRGDTIIAAAVYYPGSTKAVVGKFGARHRAALGISEVTDSITVVVSEETGRISIAHSGIIDNVKMAEFEKILRNRIA